MAQETSWTGSGRFYNIEHSVGIGGANYTDDVMLVQFYLQRVYADPMFYDAPEPGPMVVDGGCGPITRAWIKRFQEDMQKGDVPPFAIHADGRVDPVPDGVDEGSTRTLVLLTKLHRQSYPDDDVRMSPDAPPYLRQRLGRVIVTQGGGV